MMVTAMSVYMYMVLLNVCSQVAELMCLMNDYFNYCFTLLGYILTLILICPISIIWYFTEDILIFIEQNPRVARYVYTQACD